MIIICVLVQQDALREAESIAIERECAWCGELFPVKSLFSRDKYCDKHKKEAMKSRKLKDRIRHYKRYKHIKEVNELGTGGLGKSLKICEPLFYLGVKIPFSEFVEEQRVIKNNCNNNNGVTRIYKGRKTNNNIWIDNCKTMEYGESQPIGIQNTHKYATFDDYYYFSISLFLDETPPCPECGATTQCKDLKRLDVCCTNSKCGLVIKAPILHNGFTLPELPAHKQLYSHEYKEKKRIYEQAKEGSGDEGGM